METLQGAPVSTDTELGGYMNIDNDAVTTETSYPTTGKCNHTTRMDDSPTWIGDSLIGICYHTTGTAGTRWRSYTARATRGGW
uniref:Uncharacterized protein n=1 Tax=Tanacetum cinerariifolium TaxID=118510 RepID=A0A699UTU2_TANCI|nr:hypothetical protein [Tanacetum cinerariifolium]